MKHLFLLLMACIATSSLWADQTDSIPLTPRQQYQLQLQQGQFSRSNLELRIGDPVCANGMSDFYAYDCCQCWNYEKGDIWTGNFNQSVASYSFTLPAITLSYHYGFFHWLQFGPTVSYYGYGKDYTDARTGAFLRAYRNHLVNLLADVRFQYLDRRLVGIYSGIGLGLGICWDKDNTTCNTGVTPAWQVTAFGLRVGAQVYFNMELGFGVQGFGQMGIGVKF